jgi:acyl phosphate:glycerol-3-phosphate acyltransferase
MLIVISLLAAYLIGSFPTSFLMAKFFKKIDIRQHGSGNVGATNVYRVVGKLPGVVVLLIDILKGVACVTILPLLLRRHVHAVDPETLKILLGTAAIAGHVWTVFLKFKGGKGVATTAGVVACLAPKVFLLCLVVWVVSFIIFHIVSISSILSAVSLPIASLILGKPTSFLLFAVTLAIVGSYKHKANIRRLIRGEEKRLF